MTGMYRAHGQCYEVLAISQPLAMITCKVLEMAQNTHEQTMEWQSMLDLGYLWTGLDYVQAGDYFHRALALARIMHDPLILARTLNQVGNWLINLEEPLKGLEYHREALSIFQAGSDRRGLAETLDFLGVASLMSGNLIASANYYEQPSHLWRALEDRQALISSLIFFAGRGGNYFASTVVYLLQVIGMHARWRGSACAGTPVELAFERSLYTDLFGTLPGLSGRVRACSIQRGNGLENCDRDRTCSG